jgi:hypothetical protein
VIEVRRLSVPRRRGSRSWALKGSSIPTVSPLQQLFPFGAVSDVQEWPGIIMAGCDVSPPRNRSWISRRIRAFVRSVRVSFRWSAKARCGNGL